MDATIESANLQQVADRRATEESELVSLARRGNVTAFEQLYRLHVGRIHALCLRLSADPHTAEDLTQEAFVKAWRNISAFRATSAFGSWLHRIAVNTAMSLGRHEARQPTLDQNDHELSEYSMPCTPGSASTLDLEHAIAGLPSGAREVFVLHDVEGYHHTEIAVFMGTAIGTSKAQLHRARKLLRARLSI